MSAQNRSGVLSNHPVNQWALRFLGKSSQDLHPQEFAVLFLASWNDPEGEFSEDVLYRLADREGFSDLPLRLNPLEVLSDSRLPLWFPEEDEEGRDLSRDARALRFLNELQEFLNVRDPKSLQEARESAQSAVLSLAVQHSTSEFMR